MIINNTKLSRFELEVDKHIAYADYKMDERDLYINYVYAPLELRGSGAASNLMKEIKIFSEENNLDIKPICSYAVAWLKRNKN